MFSRLNCRKYALECILKAIASDSGRWKSINRVSVYGSLLYSTFSSFGVRARALSSITTSNSKPVMAAYALNFTRSLSLENPLNLRSQNQKATAERRTPFSFSTDSTLFDFNCSNGILSIKSFIQNCKATWKRNLS